MIIKRITAERLDDVLPLFSQYMHFYGVEQAVTEYATYLLERLNNQEAFIFGAYTEADKAIGFVLNYQSFSSTELGKVLVLNDLFVEPDYRNQGAANLLIRCSIELARGIQAVRVDLSTAKVNFPAQSVYEKIGFVKDSRFFSYSLSVKDHPLLNE
ncbi:MULTISPECIES: GNAT family N-acetyltransferase [unclassified Shewanella]|uniref:GNAT family N-acetyltransferase n=1 Tax=unclassified Shewanella TaxID=196818 RepID=UPI000C82208E|nr:MULTISPECIES: GNAT family N-acetyltransferase [unclassified Shewanella]MDO6619478.1 GNAT family N-acetyltransferase [Shewanella sp. 6_MG-2023]MDO6775932.1 GNAT family N-acetyltransferase [Shewanella sp. 3_MG-2023]PMG40042.1 GNAT family N-acetyltransferase [Shewanella sp. 10N.286.52.B9]